MIDKILNSRLNVIGRLFIFLTAVLVIFIAHSYFAPHIYKHAETIVAVLAQLFLTCFLLFIICLGLFLAKTCIVFLISVVVWIFTGNFSAFGDINDSLLSFVAFLLLLIYGNWNRLWFMRRKT